MANTFISYFTMPKFYFNMATDVEIIKPSSKICFQIVYTDLKALMFSIKKVQPLTSCYYIYLFKSPIKLKIH